MNIKTNFSMEINLRILMVEDLPSDVELVKRAIKKNGIVFIDQVVETKDAFIKAIEEFKPDIILSDYSLPTFDGMEALFIRQELEPDIPFILVTGTINEETAVEVMKAGADDYILKGHITRIGTAIKAALEKAEVVRLKKEADDKLRVFSRAVEQNPATIVITDVYGDIEYVNKKFEQLTRYSFDEVKGKNLRILKSGATSTEEYKQLWENITSGKEWQGEFQNIKKNGELYYEYALISPIANEEGIITHFLAVKEDITERKKAEALLRKKMDELERFHRLTVGRELTMIELKKEVNTLLKQMGKEAKYNIVEY
jgi:PAS domain S-box-containing protein